MINGSELFLAGGLCHQLHLSAVFWKGTTEPLHQSALIGDNCGFVPLQDLDVTAQDGCQGPQLLTRMWFLVGVRLPAASIHQGVSVGSNVPSMKAARVGIQS